MFRVMIFIDGSNFYHGVRDMLGKVTINYRALIFKLVGKRTIIRSYFYTPMLNKDDAGEQFLAQQRFLSYLHDIPYFQVKFGRLARQGEVMVEKSIDVKLAIDMVRYAATNQYDVAVLVSGDGDFAAAVEAVKELGKHVEVAFFPQETSSELRQVADVFRELTDYTMSDCIIQRDDLADFEQRANTF